MAKKYKFAELEQVRVKSNGAIGRVLKRYRPDHDFNTEDAYQVRFTCRYYGISGDFKESELDKPIYDHDRYLVNTEYCLGLVCYIPKMEFKNNGNDFAEKGSEEVVVDFGSKYICIGTEIQCGPGRHDEIFLKLISTKDDSIKEVNILDVCISDESKVPVSLLKGLSLSEDIKEENKHDDMIDQIAYAVIDKINDSFNFNIGDKVHYNGGRTKFPKGDYIISKRTMIGGRKFYQFKDPNHPDEEILGWFGEDYITPLVPVEPAKDYKFEIGDIVSYNGLEPIVNKSKYYRIISRTVNNYGVFLYKMESYPGEIGYKAYTNKGEYFAEKDLEYLKDEDILSDDDKQDKDFIYDIDDHVWFMNHENIIVRKMHIGLNNYYKIRIASETDDEHDYIVSEYALENDPMNKPTKEYHPISDKSLIDQFKDTINKGGFKFTKEVDSRDKSSILPVVIRSMRNYPFYKVYDLGLGDNIQEDDDIFNSIRVMVSQPLSNKSRSDIEQNRYKALVKFLEFAQSQHIREDIRIIVVDNLQFDRKPTPEEGELNHFDYLSTDIKLMKHIDYIIFAKGWQNSNGCNIEYQMAKTYGIPMWFA